MLNCRKKTRSLKRNEKSTHINPRHQHCLPESSAFHQLASHVSKQIDNNRLDRQAVLINRMATGSKRQNRAKRALKTSTELPYQPSINTAYQSSLFTNLPHTSPNRSTTTGLTDKNRMATGSKRQEQAKGILKEKC